MYADKLGYHNQSTTAGAQIKTGPAGFFGVDCTITGGTVSIYDGTSTSDTLLFSRTMAVGDVAHFGGKGFAAKKGLFIVVSAGTFNVLYT